MWNRVGLGKGGTFLKRASLALDFINGTTYPSNIAFSRTGLATQYRVDGTLTYNDHNLALYSQDFSNAAWTKTQTVTYNNATAPNGTTTASTVAMTTSVADVISQTIYSGVNLSNRVFTGSFYVKAVNSGDIGKQVVVTVKRTTGTSIVASITVYLTTSWQRVSTGSMVGLSDTVGVSLVLGSNANSPTSVQIWGAQLNEGYQTLEYMVTTSAAVYGPRIDYDPYSGEKMGLLVEQPITNTSLYSELYDNAAWTKVAATVSVPNNIIAPNGTFTTRKLVLDSTAGTTHYMYHNTGIAPTDNAYVVQSIYAKAGEITRFKLQGKTKDTTYPGAVFDLVTGQITATQTGGIATIKKLPNGWFRCSVMYNVNTGSATTILTIVLVNSSGASSFDGDGISGAYFWGAQTEIGDRPTSYVPTLGTAVTRNSDFFNFPVAGWFNPAEGTMYAEYSVTQNPGPAVLFGYVFHIDSGGNSNRLSMYLRNASNGPASAVVVNNVNQAVILNAASSPGVIQKQAFSYKLGAYYSASNGVTVSSTSGSLSTTLTTARIGVDSGPNFLNGWVKSLQYYRRARTQTDVEALTSKPLANTLSLNSNTQTYLVGQA